jgi:hypothetical protein
MIEARVVLPWQAPVPSANFRISHLCENVVGHLLLVQGDVMLHQRIDVAPIANCPCKYGSPPFGS